MSKANNKATPRLLQPSSEKPMTVSGFRVAMKRKDRNPYTLFKAVEEKIGSPLITDCYANANGASIGGVFPIKKTVKAGPFAGMVIRPAVGIHGGIDNRFRMKLFSCLYLRFEDKKAVYVSDWQYATKRMGNNSDESDADVYARHYHVLWRGADVSKFSEFLNLPVAGLYDELYGTRISTEGTETCVHKHWQTDEGRNKLDRKQSVFAALAKVTKMSREFVTRRQLEVLGHCSRVIRDKALGLTPNPAAVGNHEVLTHLRNAVDVMRQNVTIAPLYQGTPRTEKKGKK